MIKGTDLFLDEEFGFKIENKSVPFNSLIRGIDGRCGAYSRILFR
jgi:hypothetical protein